MSTIALRRPRERAWLWLAKIASGVLVFTLLIVHFVVNHLVAAGGLLSYADVLAYLANPAVKLMEGSFLVLVTAHALLGLRGISLDVNPSPTAQRVIDGLLIMIGLAAISYGLWLLSVIG